MTETARAAMSKRVLSAVGRAAGLLKRGYALALIALILWLSWLALAYLLGSLVFPAQPPQQIVELPTLGPGALERAAREFAAFRATESPRVPPRHYHRFNAWFQPDPHNDCTRSGCHSPLPHDRHKESRAFLNMHATSLHCGVCHVQGGEVALPLVWYDLRTGQAAPPPALIQAFGRLHAAGDASAHDRAERDRIVSLLRAAERQSGGSPELKGLADHLGAVRAASEGYLKLIDLAREVVPHHFRGEYGAKLAIRDERTGAPLLAHPGGADAVREFLSRGESLAPGERESLLARVHARRRPSTLACTDCHTREGSVVDWTSAGYPPQRVEALVRPMVMQAVEHIMQGRPLHLPGFVTPAPRSAPEPRP